VALHRMIVKLGIQREIETVGGSGPHHAVSAWAQSRPMGDAARHRRRRSLAREDLALRSRWCCLGPLAR
jgi:hypothetical protein